MMVLRKFAIASGVTLGIIATATACSSESNESTVTALSTTPASDVIVSENGSCDMQEDGIEAQDIPAYAEVNATYPSFVVLSDVGEGAKIRIAGADRCVWIKGGVLQDATIQVEGDGATVIVEGYVDVASSVTVIGKNSLIWMQGNNSPNIPRGTSVSRELGGQFCIDVNRVCLEPWAP